MLTRHTISQIKCSYRECTLGKFCAHSQDNQALDDGESVK